jgi:hypothetical protein
MKITKQEALRLLAKIGANDLNNDAARTVPDESTSTATRTCSPGLDSKTAAI